MDGETIGEVDFSHKLALIVGEEGRGIRPLVKKNSDIIVTIPTNRQLDSLNLSVSVGIILYEINKKLNLL